MNRKVVVNNKTDFIWDRMKHESTPVLVVSTAYKNAVYRLSRYINDDYSIIYWSCLLHEDALNIGLVFPLTRQQTEHHFTLKQYRPLTEEEISEFYRRYRHA